MSAENWLLSCMAGFIIGWLANFLSKSRYSFFVNLSVGVFGAILLNIFLKTMEILGDEFFPTFYVSILGSSALLLVFHLTRYVERRR